MRWHRLIALGAPALVVACSTSSGIDLRRAPEAGLPLDDAAPASTDAVLPIDVRLPDAPDPRDASELEDTAVPKEAGDAVAEVAPVDSGCPPPPTVRPTFLPAGFLPAETVTLVYDVDGDTAQFRFAAGERALRFLYVNTEESFGDRTTEFGKATKPIVAGWLREARKIEVALQEGKTAGSAATDEYGRLLGLVFVDGALLETRIVREGYSAYYTQFGCARSPIHESLLYAEAEAWAARRGIWKPGHPTDYRRVLRDWIGTRTCRPNPYDEPYCR